MKQILFVDDDANLLAAIERMFYPHGGQWQVTLAHGAVEALELLRTAEYDVIVTDIRMPGMSGIDLLHHVRAEHPNVVRIVLSGAADQQSTLESVSVAHQYLTKPCSSQTLRNAVERALRLRSLLENPDLRQILGGIAVVPSVPAIYGRLMQALQDADSPARAVGEIISQDVGMSAKVLQLVNSAFFGLPRRVSSPSEAVIYLGTDTIKSLATTLSVFSQFDSRMVRLFSLDELHEHSLAVGALARQIAKSLGLSSAAVDDAFVAALLHDVGKLLLATYYPREYTEVQEAVVQRRRPAQEIEREVFRATHAEVGAYLLHLWGLPLAIVEAIALHHHPTSQWPDLSNIVHLADAIVHGQIERPQAGNPSGATLSQLSSWIEIHQQAQRCIC